jgi:hypothetical protein
VQRGSSAFARRYGPHPSELKFAKYTWMMVPPALAAAFTSGDKRWARQWSHCWIPHQQRPINFGLALLVGHGRHHGDFSTCCASCWPAVADEQLQTVGVETSFSYHPFLKCSQFTAQNLTEGVHVGWLSLLYEAIRFMLLPSAGDSPSLTGCLASGCAIDL